MGKKRRIWLAAAFALLLGGLLWLVLRPTEPVYQDRPLSAWLLQYVASRRVDPTCSAALEAEHAIRQIGTSGLPSLLKLISTRDSPFTKQLIELRRAHPFWPWLMRLQLGGRAWHDRWLAIGGFDALGPTARPAVPALVHLANDADPDVRQGAVSALVHFGPEARAAVPALLKCLNDPRREMRANAMLCLANIHAQPELVVPVMTDYLQGPAPATPIRYAAVLGICNFGAQAKPAVPTLLRLLEDPDPRIRALVTNSLSGIDPAAAAQAGAK